MKTIIGQVVSLKNAQTATVLVEERRRHPLYGKFVKRSKKYACHTELADIAEGNRVEITMVKPVSKTKRFQIVRKVEQS